MVSKLERERSALAAAEKDLEERRQKLAELERDLISDRTRMALAARRAAGVKLGRPKGLKGHSKLDDKLEAITQLLRHRVSKSAIARMMGVGKSTLVDYVRSRRIQV